MDYEYFVEASCLFCIKPLPMYWHCLIDDELYSWVEDNAKGAYKGWSGAAIWEQIEDLAALLDDRDLTKREEEASECDDFWLD